RPRPAGPRARLRALRPVRPRPGGVPGDLGLRERHRHPGLQQGLHAQRRLVGGLRQGRRAGGGDRRDGLRGPAFDGRARNAGRRRSAVLRQVDGEQQPRRRPRLHEVHRDADAADGDVRVRQRRRGAVQRRLHDHRARPDDTPDRAVDDGDDVPARAVGSGGNVYGFGAASNDGDARGRLSPGAKAVHLEPTPSGKGYWIVDTAGRVTAVGDAAPLGDATGLAPGESVSSLSATPSGHGYWVFTNRGRVLPFGDAVSYGDMSGTRLNGPVLGSIATPSGRGYYMVASDGGIFAFGDAAFHGSMGAIHLNAPVESLVPTATGA